MGMHPKVIAAGLPDVPGDLVNNFSPPLADIFCRGNLDVSGAQNGGWLTYPHGLKQPTAVITGDSILLTYNVVSLGVLTLFLHREDPLCTRTVSSMSTAFQGNDAHFIHPLGIRKNGRGINGLSLLIVDHRGDAREIEIPF